MSNVQNQIKEIIDNNEVVLFMKGTKDVPMCGFSGVVVQILNKLNVSFTEVDVMTQSEMREGIKEFTNWPTLPQLYVKQEFVGGADIVREMFASGKLIQLFEEKGIAYQPLES